MASYVGDVAAGGDKTASHAFVTVNVTRNTTSGNKLLACIVFDDNGTNTVSSVTDSAGNTWANVASGYRSRNSGSVVAEMWYTDQDVGTLNSTTPSQITANISAAVTAKAISVFEFNGLPSGGTGAGQAVQGIAGTTFWDYPYTTDSNDVVVVVFGSESDPSDTFTPSGGLTLTAAGGTTGGGSASNEAALGAYVVSVVNNQRYQITNSTRSNNIASIYYRFAVPGNTLWPSAQALALIRSRNLIPISDISNTNWLRLG